MTAFTVATYNVRAAGTAGGVDAWPRRRSRLAETLGHVGADVLGLQEPTAGQLRDIERDVDRYGFHGVARDPSPGAHNPVGVGERFEVTGSQRRWLADTPKIERAGWDAAEPRSVTRVDLRDTASGRALTVCCTHFDHRGRRAREESARLLRERIDALDADREAVVLCDLNCDPESTPYRVLRGGGFERPLGDARERASSIDGPSATVTNFDSLGGGRRLDHVFVTEGVEIERYTAVDYTVAGRYASDHLPVRTTLHWR